MTCHKADAVKNISQSDVVQAGGERQGRVSQEGSGELGAETPEAGRPPWWSRASRCWKSPEAETGRDLEGQNVQEGD